MALYEKRGRRYIPVMDDRTWDSWPHGFHLVHTPNDGGRSVRFRIEPDTAGLLAAAKLKEDRLREILYQAMYMRPSKRPITKKQRAAWEAFAQAMGRDGFIVEYSSVMRIIDEAVKELMS